MLRTVAHILLAVELGAGFGTASAELISTSSNAIEVDLRVEVTQSADSVIAHLLAEGETPIVLPFLQREAGVFGIRTELKQVNYRVIFELLGPEPAQSEPRTLTELGLEFPGADPVSTTTTDPEALPASVTSWLWLAIAFGAAALSALAFWALGGENRQSSSEEASTDSDAADI
jgi:hypothetical protein